MSSRPVFIAFDVPKDVAAGTEIDVSNYKDKWVQIGGTGWVATVAIEGSINGTDWEVVTTLTSKGIVELLPMFRLVRANTTAYTSGSPSGTFAGRDQR